MGSQLKLKNANGVTTTIANEDTNTSNITLNTGELASKSTPVADRVALLARAGIVDGEAVWQTDIGLMYIWTNIQGVDNGGTIINVGNGSWIASYSGAVNIKWFGAKGDGVADDTVAIQNALNYKGGSTYSSPFQSNGGGTVYIPDGTFRITNTVYHPEWVCVVGNFHGAVSGSFNPSIKTDLKGSIIYADFTTAKKTAWAIVGKWLKGVNIGEFIELTEETIPSLSYDNGDITRQYGCKLSDITFTTDKDVYIGVGFAGAPSIEIKRVSSYGFLTGIRGDSSWGIRLESLNVRAGHCSLGMYNLKGGYFSGYFTKSSTSVVLNDITKPPFWYENEPVHNPLSIEFLSTCLYARYNSACTYDVVLENHERGIAEFNTFGTTYTSPYIEAIEELPLHSVASYIDITAGRLYLPNKKFARVSSSGKVTVSAGAAVLEAWDYGSQTSYDAKAQLEVIGLTDLYSIPSLENYSPAITFSTLRSEDKIIYVSSTGEDDNTGLNSNNAVSTLHTAFERAKYYDCYIVELESGGTYSLDNNATIDKPLEIRGNTSNIDVDGDRIIFLNSNIIFSDVTINVPFGTSISTAGIFIPRNFCSITLKNSTINCESDTGILVGSSDNSSIANLNLNSVTITGASHLGRNDYHNLGKVKVVFNYSEDCTLSTDIFESNFTVL